MEGLSPDRQAAEADARHLVELIAQLTGLRSDGEPAGNRAERPDDRKGMALDEADAYLTTLGEPRELRVLLNLSYSLQMLRRLPWYACDDLMPELPRVLRQASRDAFFTHTRLVTEFFWKLPDTHDNARLFLPSWQPPEELAQQLEARWTQAMTFIAPLGRDRRPSDLIEPHGVDLDALALEQIVFDCDTTVETFVTDCEAAGIEFLPEVRTLLASSTD
jgi:hypothetical protein